MNDAAMVRYQSTPTAVANLELDPELSVLLASEAVETTRSSDGTVLPEGEEALHSAVVASRLELEVPGLGGLLAWSSRGVFVTEGPENSGMIDIRDAETGESVLAFEAHDGDINDVGLPAAAEPDRGAQLRQHGSSASGNRPPSRSRSSRRRGPACRASG